MSGGADKIFTYALTDSTGESGSGSITVVEAFGVQILAVKCTSTALVTVTGGAALGSLQSEAISLAENECLTIAATAGSVINGVTVTCAGGATADITATI